jgi:alanyl-tRNA synthetase
VRVVCFGEWTCELCGGTHVESSAQTGPVLILSEGSIGAGLRRIEFLAAEAAEELIYNRSRQVGELARMLGTRPDEISEAVEHVRSSLRESEREKRQLQERLMRQQAATVETDGGVPFSHAAVSEEWVDLKARADLDLEHLSGPGVVLVTRGDEYVLKVDRQLTDRFDATKLKDALGSKGGGRAELVQGKLTVSVDEALKRLKAMLR